MNFLFPRSHSVLELLDFVVQNELELLKLLSLLAQRVDVRLLLSDALFALLELLVLLLYRSSVLYLGFDELLKFFLHVCDFAVKLVFIALGGLQLALHFSELLFGLHASVYDFAKLFFILFLYQVDLVPCVVFDLLAPFFVFLYHKSELVLQVLELLFLRIFLMLVLKFEFFPRQFLLR